MFQMEKQQQAPSFKLSYENQRTSAGHCVSKQFSVSLLAWPQTLSQLWLQYQGVASWLFTVKLVGREQQQSRVTSLQPLELHNSVHKLLKPHFILINHNTWSAKTSYRDDCTLRFRGLVSIKHLPVCDSVSKLQCNHTNAAFFALIKETQSL